MISLRSLVKFYFESGIKSIVNHCLGDTRPSFFYLIYDILYNSVHMWPINISKYCVLIVDSSFTNYLLLVYHLVVFLFHFFHWYEGLNFSQSLIFPSNLYVPQNQPLPTAKIFSVLPSTCLAVRTGFELPTNSSPRNFNSISWDSHLLVYLI